MNLKIICAGKPALDYAKKGIDEYLKRLKPLGSYELKIIKAGSSSDVSKRLWEASEKHFRIVLDERGKQITTREFAAKINTLEMQGAVKSIALLIGASDGHTSELRQKADLVLSLSKLTMQHELALVVLLEQLYRLETIKRNSPYHRD